MDIEQLVEAETILTRLEELKEESHVAPDYVDFCSGLFLAQVNVLKRIEKPASTGTFPLVRENINFDEQALLAMVDWLRSRANTEKGEPDELRLLYEWGKEEAGRLLELAGIAAFDDELEKLSEWAAEEGISAGTFFFTGRAMAAPFVMAQAAVNKEAGVVVPSEEQAGNCPVCGSPPGLAMLVGEEGKRILACSLCGEQWRFTRLECPECGNEDQDKMGTLSMHDDDPAWLEVCLECKAAIKTFNCRKQPEGEKPLALPLMVGTLHLEMVANQQELSHQPPYLALG